MPTNNEQTGFLQASDHTSLFYRQWLHPQARGAIVLVHGLGEHSGRYGELADLFHTAGLSVRAYDLRGHGQSGGARGSLRGDDDLINDLKLVFDDFARSCQSTPFLFGHSLGGLVAARFATGDMSPVRGVLLSSPALAIRMNGFQRLLLALTTRIAPALAVPTSLPAHKVSHDAGLVQAYRADPLNHGKVAARVVNFMLSAMAQVQRDAAGFRLPLLLQMAGDDAFVDPQGSRAFFAQVPPLDKCLHCYEDAYHEIFNESAERRLLAQDDLKAWLASHLP